LGLPNAPPTSALLLLSMAASITVFSNLPFSVYPLCLTVWDIRHFWIKEGGVWGEYYVGEEKGEKRGGARLKGAPCYCFEGEFSVKRVYLNNIWYQER
jgi:hypothetical protein